MLAKIRTVSFIGLEIIEVTVEVHIGNGLPCFSIVGLPDKNIFEAKDRIRAVFNVIGVSLPAKRITINMSPANLPKEGSHYDLPIALGILVACGVVSQNLVENWLVIGEISLDGGLNLVKGALLAAIYANFKNYTLVGPLASAVDIKLSGNENVLIFKNILEVVNFQNIGTCYSLHDYTLETSNKKYEIDMLDVEGQYTAKRILEIAAVFRQNILMIGAPGIGKSMLAKRAITILPNLTYEEYLEINMIYSIVDGLQKRDLFEIPYRDPHFSITLSGLIGGGLKATPGEVTLAHKGILFLDELGEYSKALEALRQCMEDKYVIISRANRHIKYPADCQVIAAMNPCKCGYYNTDRQCHKIPYCSRQYREKISGPLLDRFDFIVYLDNEERYVQDKFKETSEKIKNRVENARQLYLSKYSKNFKDLIIDDIKVDKTATNLLNDYCSKKQISKRNQLKLLKSALSISLLDDSSIINKTHLSEAVMYNRFKI